MPRKPKVERQTFRVLVNGNSVEITVFPPSKDRGERSWYAYWKGLKTRRSTGKQTRAEAIEAATAIVQGRSAGATACGQWPTDKEFIDVQQLHFSKREDRSGKGASLTSCLEAIDAFKRVSGLAPICRATPDDCERFQTEALKLPRNWRSQYPKSKPETRTVAVETVLKWLAALRAAFERVNDNAAGRKCVRGVIPSERLLKSNPWARFKWLERPKKKIEQFSDDNLLNLLEHFRTTCLGVTVAESMIKVFFWSWARREEVAGLKWDSLRIVEDEVHFDINTKWGKEWWFRIPQSLYEELESFRTDSPFVFAKLNDQIREFHQTRGNEHFARSVKDFKICNAGEWFYKKVKAWDKRAYVHMFRKTSLQYARIGEDVSRSLARDAGVSERVMMASYVKEEDVQFHAASNAMFERLCLSKPEVAKAFGHVPSATAKLETQIRQAVCSQNWPLVAEIAQKLSRPERQAG